MPRSALSKLVFADPRPALPAPSRRRPRPARLSRRAPARPDPAPVAAAAGPATAPRRSYTEILSSAYSTRPLAAAAHDRPMRWRGRRAAVLVLVGIVGATALTRVLAAGAQVIPAPDLLVVVTTKSGSVTRTSLVPIGAPPIPIDVDGTPSPRPARARHRRFGRAGGDRSAARPVPIAPNVVVRRNALAIALKRPAPPLEIDAKIVLRDAGNGLATLAEMHYGFTTPPGNPRTPRRRLGQARRARSRAASSTRCQAKLDSPGANSGPLNFHINVPHARPRRPTSGSTSTRCPRRCSSSNTHASTASTPPTATRRRSPTCTWTRRRRCAIAPTNELVELVAPTSSGCRRRSPLSSTVTEEQTLRHLRLPARALAKPDVRATYRDTDGAGVITTDAALRIEGLPFHMRGQIDTSPWTTRGHTSTRSTSAFSTTRPTAAARSRSTRWSSSPATGSTTRGRCPSPTSDPISTSLSRHGGSTPTHTPLPRGRTRPGHPQASTTGRASVPRTRSRPTTDLGDGVRPLRALVDIDTRGPAADADAQRMQLERRWRRCRADPHDLRRLRRRRGRDGRPLRRFRRARHHPRGDDCRGQRRRVR